MLSLLFFLVCCSNDTLFAVAAHQSQQINYTLVMLSAGLPPHGVYFMSFVCQLVVCWWSARLQKSLAIGKKSPAAWLLGLGLLLSGCSATQMPYAYEDTDAPMKPIACAATESQLAAEQALLDLINVERACEGLSPVKRDLLLDQAASDHACQMIRHRFFAHQHPVTGDGPGDRALIAGYAFAAIGENLASGVKEPNDAVREWLKSNRHLEVLLDPRWRHTGIAVRKAEGNELFWVQLFGVPYEESPNQ